MTAKDVTVLNVLVWYFVRWSVSRGTCIWARRAASRSPARGFFGGKAWGRGQLGCFWSFLLSRKESVMYIVWKLEIFIGLFFSLILFYFIFISYLVLFYLEKGTIFSRFGLSTSAV